MSYVAILNKIRHFQVVSRAVRANKCTKTRDARTKLLFCQTKSIAFLWAPNGLNELPEVGSNIISLQPDWQIDNGFFNRPIIGRTQILVHRWGPKDFGAVSQTDLTRV